MGEICISHQWSSSSVLSLYYLCSGSYDLSHGHGLFINGHQVWPFRFLHLKNIIKTLISPKQKLESSENAPNALPYISAGVYVQSRERPFLVGLPCVDKACMCIWTRNVGNQEVARPSSPDLTNKSRKKLNGDQINMETCFKKILSYSPMMGSSSFM